MAVFQNLPLFAGYRAHQLEDITLLVLTQDVCDTVRVRLIDVTPVLLHHLSTQPQRHNHRIT